MSRHRNVRNLIDEDYYDYDDDDDYYDGYDDAPPPPPKKKSPAKKAPAKQQQQQQQQQSQKQKEAAERNRQKQLQLQAQKKAAVASKVAPAAAVSAAPGPTTSKLSVTFAGSGSAATQKLNAGLTTTSTTNNSNNNNAMAAAAVASPAVPECLKPAAQQKVPLTLVILGHVDAGKSTLTGRLLYSATANASNNKKQNDNTNMNYAWLLDEDEKERQHGVTMDIATKTLTTPDTVPYNIVLQDAPGHADYVPAMITGTASADAALLTVDVTNVETAMSAGQLREHIYLAKGLGIQQILVALNKLDLIGWDQEKYNKIVHRLQTFLTGKQIGYANDKVRFVPVSGLTGVNVITKKQQQQQNENDDDSNLLTSWYTGPTLQQAVFQFQAPPTRSKLLEKPVRILLADVDIEASSEYLTKKGGVTCRAKVVQGWITMNQPLTVLPSGDTTGISKLYSLQQQQQQQQNSNNNSNESSERNNYGAAGELIECTLSGIDPQRLSPGSVLSRPNQQPKLANKCRAKVFLLDNSGGSGTGGCKMMSTVPIIRGATCIFHMHYLDVPCHFSALLHTLKQEGGKEVMDRKNPRALTAKSSPRAVVELTLQVPICLEAFTDCRALGRFVLRRSGESVAVGRIEQVL